MATTILYNKLKINSNNYKNEYNDLLGIRLIALTKRDTFQFLEKLIILDDVVSVKCFYSHRAYHDKFLEIKKDYTNKNIIIIDRSSTIPYDSIHVRMNNKTIIDINVEIQIRTYFEEAWGEVDHDLKYPYKMDDQFLIRQMKILNSFAYNADEIISFVYDYRDLIYTPKEAKKDAIATNIIIGELMEILDKDISQDEIKEEIKKIMTKERPLKKIKING